jgi:hypothetical protein
MRHAAMSEHFDPSLSNPSITPKTHRSPSHSLQFALITPMHYTMMNFLMEFLCTATSDLELNTHTLSGYLYRLLLTIRNIAAFSSPEMEWHAK